MSKDYSNASQGELSLTEKSRGRRLFSVFSVFNTFSFLLLSGNILTLYLIRLGASSSLIGFISSFTYISFFFMIPGRRVVESIGVVRLFAYCWTFRYLATIPLLFSPFFILRGSSGIGFGLVIFGSLGFQIMRGVGLVSNSPIMGALSEGKDRGDYLSQIQIITQAASIITGLSIAFLLSGEGSPLGRYSIFILAGIVLGLLGSALLFKLPSHTGQVQKESEGVISASKRAFTDPSFRRFIRIFALVTFIAGMSRPFIILYAAAVYGIADSDNMYLSVIGSVGALTMGFIAQLLLDRLGAKPILVFFSGVFFLILLPFIFAPSFPGMGNFVFLGVLFFFFNLGSLGQENASQTYFYAAIRPEDQLNLGILYYFTYGIGGTLGSLAGGFLLDIFTGLGFSPVSAMRIFFGLLALASFLVVTQMLRLAALGSYSVRGALNVIFSARDLRAIILLNRLDKTTTVQDERKVIQEMGTSPSAVTIEGLLGRLKSPSFTIRTETLKTLENMKADTRVIEALIQEVKTQEYSTAYRGARILGMKRVYSAVPVLREAMKSEDYLLCAESMLALAFLKDHASLSRIEAILKMTKNPLLMIHAAEALRVYGEYSSLPVLLDVMGREDLPENLRNHMVLSVAGILGMEGWFYPFFTEFLDDPRNGIDMVVNEVTKNRPTGPFRYNLATFRRAFFGIIDDTSLFLGFLGEVFQEAEFQTASANLLRELFITALKDPNLMKHKNVCFFFASVFVRHLPR